MSATLLLSPRYTSDSIALWRAALSAGWAVERLQNWRTPTAFKNHSVVVYGEPLFGNAIAETLSLVLLEPSLSWLADLPTVYRQREVRFTTLREARLITEPAFIKPAYDKVFLAQVYESGAQLPTAERISDSTPVIISEPVSWEVEFRCFILDGEVMTMSPYLRYGSLAQSRNGSWSAELSEINQAFEFCTAVLNDPTVQVPPAMVVDVGKIVGKGWAVIEANPAWASGIYGCHPSLVLPVIQRACVPRDQLRKQDKDWVLEHQFLEIS